MRQNLKMIRGLKAAKLEIKITLFNVEARKILKKKTVERR